MPRLFILSGNDLGQSHEFDGSVSVGRAADVTVRAPSISRKHAQIELEDDVWYVRDLGSRNGVFVDGERTQRAALHDGAVFRLGEVELRFRAIEPAAQTPVAPVVPVQPVELEAPVEPEATLEYTTETEFSPTPIVDDIELELEGDWDDSPPPPPAAPAVAPTPPTPARPAKAQKDAAAARAEAMGGTLRGEKKTSSGGRVLQYSRIENRSGLMNADLSQQPLWLRSLAYLFAIALLIGLAYGAFLAVRMLRG